MTPDQLKNFEQAFSTHGGGCRRECKCGKVFYNSDGGWDWEDGELKELDAMPNATNLPYTVGTIAVEGKEYVVDCTCWHERAGKIVEWLEDHAQEVAEFLTLEKKRKQKEADESPVVAA